MAGIIDFDVASPGARAWDVAYAAYRWAPVTRTNDAHERFELFCDSYGIEPQKVRVLMARRVQALHDRIVSLAAKGDPTAKLPLERGDAARYAADAEYLRKRPQP